MFIDVAKFKKVLKASCDGLGVKVAHYANDLIQISGSGWILEVHEEDITNKCMAALAEYFGQLPRAGKAYEYQNKKKEETVLEYDGLEPEETLLETFEKAYNAGARVEDTRLMIQRFSTCYSVFQTQAGCEPMLLRRDLQVMVDPDKTDDEHEELPPDQPVLAGYMIIYNNDTMQLALATTPVHNSGERAFLGLITGKDMRWDFED